MLVAWLAGAIAILVYNSINWVMGPSICCPHCSTDQLTDRAFETAQKLNENDKRRIGLLQLPAKVLDVLTVLLFAASIYSWTIKMALSPKGVPARYLLTHLHYANLGTVIAPSLHNAAKPLAPERGRMGFKERKAFSYFVVVIGLLANATGWAFNVLLIPDLQWKDTREQLDQGFWQLALENVSSGLCTSSIAQRSERDYSCTLETYGSMLNSWFDSQIVDINQRKLNNVIPSLDGITQENSLMFKINATDDNDPISWVPNRQVVRSLSEDYEQFKNSTQGKPHDSSFDEYNWSLLTTLKRKGPIIGFTANQSYNTDRYQGETSKVSTHSIGKDKSIRCYADWGLQNTNKFTKCYRVGKGWGSSNRQANFTVYSTDHSDTRVYINIYFSDRSTYFNTSNHTGSSPPLCLESIVNIRTPDENCNWDEIFSAKLLDELSSSSNNVMFIEYTVESPSSSIHFVYEFVTYSTFPTYALDISTASNPLKLVHVRDLGRHRSDPLIVHPDWILAAWSADHNGNINAVNRTSARILLHSLMKPLTDRSPESSYEGSDSFLPFTYLNTYSIAQALSMVSYDVGNGPTTDDPQYRISHYASRYIWALGGSDITTRVAKGLIILSGAVFVASYIYICVQPCPPSMMDLLAAAFRTAYDGELDRADDKKARVRYRMVKNGGQTYKFEQVHRLPAVKNGAAEEGCAGPLGGVAEGGTVGEVSVAQEGDEAEQPMPQEEGMALGPIRRITEPSNIPLPPVERAPMERGPLL